MSSEEDLPTTERRNPASAALGSLSGRELAALMNREDRRTLDAVGAQLDALGRAVEAVAERLRRGGRLLYVGAGTSGRLGVLDASECPPTFGTEPGQVIGLIAGGIEATVRAAEGAEDEGPAAVAALEELGLSADDCVVGISASGRTPYAVEAVRHARGLGSLTVAICCNEDSVLAREAELPIELIVGPEVLTGSTRLKAGTATKMALNILSTGAMVRLGRTRGNLMSALRPGSQKLRERSRRVLATEAGIDEAQAAAILDAHDGELQAALAATLHPGAAMDPEDIVHLSTPDWWQSNQDADELRPASLQSEGFVHCSRGAQVEATIGRHFAGHDHLVLLVLDRAALGEALVFEDTSGHGVFPHVYGPIPRAAVRRTVDWRR